MTEFLNVLFFIAVIAISVFFLRKLYFAGVCMTRAIKSKQIGVTKRDYLRYEMPNNDIENQIEDEIKINMLYIVGIALWPVTLMFFDNASMLLIIYSIYGILVFMHIKLAKGLQDRYNEYYNVFKTKTKREDFSDELVTYGLRIEGTLTKLKETYALSIVYIAFGFIMTFIQW